MLLVSTWALASLGDFAGSQLAAGRTRIGAFPTSRKRAFPLLVSFMGVRSSDVPESVKDLLTQIAAIEGLTLKGKTQTAIYRKSKPFLHFHWNNEEIVADVRFEGPAFSRVPVNTPAERRRLVREVRAFVAGS